ncbi:MAG: methyltransferase domain-containing protein [Chloroflexota bacterium]
MRDLSNGWRSVVEFGFRLLYNEMAWSYDLVSWGVSLGEWRVWQKQSLAYLKGKRVLEIAHGPGHMLIEMHGRGFEVFGVDLSEAMGQQARSKLSATNLKAHISLARCRIPDFPFAAEHFDSVLSQFPTNFIFDPATLANLHRLLKPGGMLVILPEGHLTGSGPILRLIAWLFYITGQAASPQPLDETIQLEFGPFIERIEAAGFETEIITMRFKRSAATVIIGKKPVFENGQDQAG